MNSYPLNDKRHTPEWVPRPCVKTTVYMVIRSNKFKDAITHNILPQAFHRRKRSDGCIENGPSVLPLDACPSYEQIEAEFRLNKPRGVDSLKVESVERLELSVVHDKEKHAYIEGVPYVDESQSPLDISLLKKRNELSVNLCHICVKEWR